MALISTRTRERLTKQLQARFDKEAERLAKRLLEKGSRVREWHTGMRRLIVDHLLQQAIVGKGGPLTSQELARLNTLALEQQAFLSRWSDELGLRRMRHQKVNLEGLVNRASQYAAPGLAEYRRGFELSQSDDGTVFDFVSRDAPTTCTPCLIAEEGSPYAAGSGPMPAAVCAGGSRCHCVRVARFAPEEARRLRAA